MQWETGSELQSGGGTGCVLEVEPLGCWTAEVRVAALRQEGGQHLGSDLADTAGLGRGEVVCGLRGQWQGQAIRGSSWPGCICFLPLLLRRQRRATCEPVGRNMVAPQGHHVSQTAGPQTPRQACFRQRFGGPGPQALLLLRKKMRPELQVPRAVVCVQGPVAESLPESRARLACSLGKVDTGDVAAGVVSHRCGFWK